MVWQFLPVRQPENGWEDFSFPVIRKWRLSMRCAHCTTLKNELREVVKSYEKAYTSNKTEENAKRYNASFEMLLQTMQLACDISIEYSGITYDDEGAPIGLFISYVTGNHEKYESLKKH